ncbi:uncharacterized protein METZ01_LOCUS415335 [marine metagenome]|uniref:Uncharacterized protein n=1 Tax=marine metagenome TaxID=408172 RepID=A0A382WWW0_9ZZZZ
MLWLMVDQQLVPAVTKKCHHMANFRQFDAWIAFSDKLAKL